MNQPHDQRPSDEARIKKQFDLIHACFDSMRVENVKGNHPTDSEMFVLQSLVFKVQDLIALTPQRADEPKTESEHGTDANGWTNAELQAQAKYATEQWTHWMGEVKSLTAKLAESEKDNARLREALRRPHEEEIEAYLGKKP